MSGVSFIGSRFYCFLCCCVDLGPEVHQLLEFK